MFTKESYVKEQSPMIRDGLRFVQIDAPVEPHGEEGFKTTKGLKLLEEATIP